MKISSPKLWLIIMGLLPTFLFAQTPGLKLKLQLMPDGQTWGVYVKPEGISPSTNYTTTINGGKLVVVMPLNYEWNSLTSVNGIWSMGGSINGPVEAPDKSFCRFDLQTEITPIPYQSGVETLLFTFKGSGTCPEDLQLFDNDGPLFDHPACDFPPENELTVFDAVTVDIYTYTGNYASAAWDCHDNDGDGILNAHEDTNGNGSFDPGVDATDLNTADFAQTNDAMKFKLQLMPDGETWGVYMKPEEGINLSLYSPFIGTGQVSVVMPKDFEYNSLTSVNGIWAANSVLNGPNENPTKKYVSFGFQSAIFPINIPTNQEILLFTFKKTSDCPGDLYLVDNSTDPLGNFGNEITIYENISQTFLSYGGNYAPAAWDCHDNDGDGVVNAHEDSNGNGIYDPGVDVSDLNQGNSSLPIGCVKLKLQLMPDSTSWGVFAKASDGYAPSANAVATGGRVTIVAPSAMPIGSIESANGLWSLTNTLQGATPGRKFLTFQLSSNATGLGLNDTEPTLLFQFDKLGDCPDSLFLMENYVPASLSPNSFSGYDPSSFTSSGFEYCGVYARKAWRCKKSGGSIPPTVVTEDSFKSPMPGTATDAREDADFAEGSAAEGHWFTASPNPASDYVSIVLSEKLAADGSARTSLALWDLQGKKRLENKVESTTTLLDLSGLPAGVYFVALAQNGRVVERTKIVKH